MSLDPAGLAAVIARVGPVARVLVAEAKGSVPRGAGTSMLVWADGSDGTIGGGALEWQAMAMARGVLASGAPRVLRMPLGPGLGQCCGGAVTLVVERLDSVPPVPWLRRVEGKAPAPEMASFGLRNGWLWEGARAQGAPVWIWGAGHVGLALARVLAPLPEVDVTLIDTDVARLRDVPDGVAPLVAAQPDLAMARAPKAARHIILTYSHDMDLSLCHAALRHGFASCGLIGSATKWARFRTRLAAMGHDDASIARIACPIGDPALGKHPQAIAVSVANGLLTEMSALSGSGKGEI